MSEFERIIADSMTCEDGQEWTVGYAGVDWEDEADYTPGLDDGEWVEYEEDTDWDVYGEEEFA